MKKEMIISIKKEVKDLFTESGVNAILAAVDQEIEKFTPPSADTSAGRKEIKSFKMTITKTRTFLEKQGKEFIAEKKAAIKVFDSGRKKLRDGLAEREKKVLQPVTEFETKEAARLEAERQKEIFNMDHEEALAMNDLFNRERELARREAELKAAEDARLAEEKRLKEEQERKEREERIKKEAAEKAKREAEEKALREKAEQERKLKEAEAAKAQAERDKIAAEERARLEKEDALRRAEQEKLRAIKEAEEKALQKKLEEERIAAEEKAVAEKKAADKKHQAEIHNSIRLDIELLGVETSMAKSIVTAMVKHEIRYVSINY